MEQETQLRELVREIRPTDTQHNDLRDAHIRLRERLMADDALKPLIVGTFLQGSYRRHTGIRPQNGDKPDVDIVVVTRLDQNQYTPEAALNVLQPFLNRYYPGRWKKKGRSIGIEMSKIKLDVVLTSAPSESAERAVLEILSQDDTNFSLPAGSEWKNEPLWIPDREARAWQPTYPLEQIRWTHEKNRKTNGHYIHVVKLVKWWWQTRHPEQEHPRSYPLEHIVGDCCSDGVTTLSQAFGETMAEIARRYQYIARPYSHDRGVPDANVLARITEEDASSFGQSAAAATAMISQAIASVNLAESSQLWREIFGNRFPVGKDQSGFTPREAPGQIKGGRFG